MGLRDASASKKRQREIKKIHRKTDTEKDTKTDRAQTCARAGIENCHEDSNYLGCHHCPCKYFVVLRGNWPGRQIRQSQSIAARRFPNPASLLLPGRPHSSCEIYLRLFFNCAPSLPSKKLPSVKKLIHG